MPFVNIRLVREVIADDPERVKAKISRDVTASIARAADIPPENVWIVFEEVAEVDWFAGGKRVKELREKS